MFRSFLVAAILLASVTSAAPRTSFAQSADRDDVATTVRAFHDALSRGDSLAALKLLAPDVQVLESGSLESLSEYRSHHLPADIAFARALPGTRAEPIITVRGEVAWAVGTSKTSGTYRDRLVNSAGAELMVLTRTAAGWRISAIHWSSRTIRTP